MKKKTNQSGMFNGRLNRIGFFMAGFILILPLIFVAVMQAIASHLLNRGTGSTTIGILNVVSILVGIVVILVAIPVVISVGVRRWHDIGQSGWFVLFNFIPYMGGLVALVMLFIPGTKGPNPYGKPDTAPSTLKKILFNM